MIASLVLLWQVIDSASDVIKNHRPYAKDIIGVINDKEDFKN